MNCNKAEKWLSQALDGELPEARLLELRRHVEQCAACRRLEQEWQACRGLAQETAAAPAQTPEAAWADVRRSIRLQTPARQPAVFTTVFNWRIQAASAILMLCVLGVGLFLMNRSSPLQQAAVAPAVMANASVAQQAGPAPATVVEMVETSLPDATPMVYEDSSSGMMVIWVMVNGDKEKKHVGS